MTASSQVGQVRQNADCPLCTRAASRSLPAQIAPFIRARCDLPPEAEARSHFCDLCEHVFLTPFLTDDNLARLYDGYRNGAYTAQRMIYEPGYGSVAEMFGDPESAHHQTRRNFYDEFRTDAFGTRGLVIDAGDGDGYFGRYAYPHADVVTLPRAGPMPPGVVLPDLVARTDVLMIAHSLQNQPRPREALRRLTEGLPADALIWIEVPVEYAGALRESFRQLVDRVARGVREFGALQTLHENLAHFSVRSLRRLLTFEGFTAMEFVRSSAGILGVLARRTGTDPQPPTDSSVNSIPRRLP